jgi:hypothetical protein
VCGTPHHTHTHTHTVTHTNTHLPATHIVVAPLAAACAASVGITETLGGDPTTGPKGVYGACRIKPDGIAKSIHALGSEPTAVTPSCEGNVAIRRKTGVSGVQLWRHSGVQPWRKSSCGHHLGSGHSVVSRERLIRAAWHEMERCMVHSLTDSHHHMDSPCWESNAGLLAILQQQRPRERTACCTRHFPSWRG